MFNRGIRICTGTGIGAALSTCIQSPDWYFASNLFLTTNELTSTRFLIWIGSDQEKTFGPTITNLIYQNIEPERMILWDSKKRGGRPDTVQLLKDTWASFGAEVIFITSNMKGNDEMMQGCREGTFYNTEMEGMMLTCCTQPGYTLLALYGTSDYGSATPLFTVDADHHLPDERRTPCLLWRCTT